MVPGKFVQVAAKMSARFSLNYDNKDVLAANHMPIAPLPIPVTVFIGMPVGVIPIGIGVDKRKWHEDRACSGRSFAPKA